MVLRQTGARLLVAGPLGRHLLITCRGRLRLDPKPITERPIDVGRIAASRIGRGDRAASSPPAQVRAAVTATRIGTRETYLRIPSCRHSPTQAATASASCSSHSI